MKTYGFFGIFRRLVATGLALMGQKKSKHAGGRAKSLSWQEKDKRKRRRIRKLARAARRRSRPRHSRRRRVVSKGKSAHSSRSW